MKLLVCFMLLSISIPAFSKSKTYTIPKGKHYSKGLHFGYFHNEIMSIKAKFNSSAIYSTVASGNQADINKLYGFSDCWSAHHKNSARFGWRYLDNKLELMAYVYSGKQRSYLKLGDLEMDKWQEMNIKVDSGKYIFKFNGKSFEMPRGCKTKKANGYKLFPYFGGDETAPHEIKIEIE